MHRRSRAVTLLLALWVTLLLAGAADAAPRQRARPTVTVSAARQRAAKARTTRQIRQVVQEKGLRSAAVKQAFVGKQKSTYSLKVPSTPILDQEQSGRCWAFAWTKTLQSMALSKGAKQVSPLSASFINYHALRALAHGAIDKAGRTAARPEFNISGIDGDSVGEGGYAHWANDIVKRHGIVPEQKMRSDTFDARRSHVLQNQLHRLVTAAAEQLWSKGTTQTKRSALTKQYKKEIDTLLATTIGKPPRSFVVDGKRYTPKTYRHNALKIADKDLSFVTLSHDPTRAFNRRYKESYPDGIPEGQTYNVSMATIQSAVKGSLKQGVAAQVAVNVDWDNPHRVANRSDGAAKKNGILSLAAFGYEKVVPTHKISKRVRMQNGVSMANHMMAITGHEPKKRGEQARWQIDNSHGRKAFRGGRFDMHADFFKQYVEEVTVPRSAVPKALLAKLEAKPALDTVGGMPALRKKGERWTPQRKTALVQALLRQDLSIDDAAKRYDVPAKTLQKWQQTAERAMAKALRSK